LITPKINNFPSNHGVGHIPWHLFIVGDSYQRILEIGCGRGLSTLSLAEKYNEVYACDHKLKNLLILKKQAKIHSIKNIRCCCGFKVPVIPFKDNVFNVVFINQNLSLKTNSVFLAEVWRVLKDTGMVYFGAENKFSYKKLKQIKEKIVNIFPPFQNSEHKDQTLSIYGYKKLLKKSGFTSTEIFSLMPDSNQTNSMEALDHKAPFNIKKSKHSGNLSIKKRVKNSKIIKKYMTPFFGIFSKKTSDLKNTVDTIIGEVTVFLNNGSWEISDSAFQITQKGTFVFKLINQSMQQEIIVKISLNSVTKKQLGQNYQQIASVHENDCISGDIKEIVPIPMMHSVCNKYNYYIEELKAGETAVSFHRSPEILNRILFNSAQKILQLHSATKKLNQTSVTEQKNILDKKIDKIRKFLGNEYNENINAVNHYLRDTILKANLPLVFHKGDCSAHNILVSQDYSITALIDWDQSLQYGLPLVDLINLIESFKRHSLKQSMGSILIDYLFLEKLSDLDKELFSQYCNKMEISLTMIFPLCVIYWIDHVTAQDFTNDDKWMKNNVFSVMDYLKFRIKTEGI